MKPSYKTGEFWISVAASGLGIVMSSGVLDSLGPNHWIVQVVGMLVALLGALGFTVPRMALKQAQIKADAVANVAAQETTRSVLGAGVSNPPNPSK
jgi:hypothetical protein